MDINRDNLPMKITCRINKYFHINLLFFFGKLKKVEYRDPSLASPLRVRLRSSVPLARRSWLSMPRNFSTGTSSPLELLLGIPLLPLPQNPIPAIPFSSGVTAAIFHTSFRALAFKVAAPLRAAWIQITILFNRRDMIFSYG